MSVYVDDVFVPSRVPRLPQCFREGVCHMWADREDELHEFAHQIGLRRGWFQPHGLLPHYDLTPARRRRAVAAGAVQVRLKDYLRRSGVARG